MEPRACRVCGKSIPDGTPLYRLLVRVACHKLPSVTGEWVRIGMYLCENCHEAVDLTDLMDAAEDGILVELRKARQPCCKTTRVKETDDGH